MTRQIAAFFSKHLLPPLPLRGSDEVSVFISANPLGWECSPRSIYNYLKADPPLPATKRRNRLIVMSDECERWMPTQHEPVGAVPEGG